MELNTPNMRELMPLCVHLEMDLVRATPDEVVGSMEWSEETTTTGGAMHGDGAADPQRTYDDRGRDRADRGPGPPRGPYDPDTGGAGAADWVA